MQTSKKKTMVCVTVQKTCERLIREGHEIANGGALLILHIAKEGQSLLGSDNDGEALNYLFQIAKEYSAEMDVIRSVDVAATLMSHAKKHQVECIVLGASGKRKGKTLSDKLSAKLHGVDVVII